MEKTLLTYIALPWAVVGIADGTSMTFASLIGQDETPEAAVERYVTGYMAYWNIAFIDKPADVSLPDAGRTAKAQQRIEAYAEAHPPVRPLPRFYIIFLNQPQIGCDADGFSDVFCF